MYAVILTVADVLGNQRSARRFVMYDNISKVETIDCDPLFIASADNATNFIWQTDLQDSSGQGPNVGQAMIDHTHTGSNNKPVFCSCLNRVSTGQGKVMGI